VLKLFPLPRRARPPSSPCLIPEAALALLNKAKASAGGTLTSFEIMLATSASTSSSACQRTPRPAVGTVALVRADGGLRRQPRPMRADAVESFLGEALEEDGIVDRRRASPLALASAPISGSCAR
jgi:hypothetical protein